MNNLSVVNWLIDAKEETGSENTVADNVQFFMPELTVRKSTVNL